MSNPVISESYYHKIYQQIDRFLKPERQAGSDKLNWIRMKSYWKVGRLLSREAKKLNFKEFYQLRTHLNVKLNYDERKLQRLQRFYETWPRSIPAKTPERALPWSKYIELITVEDPKARQFYLQETLSSDWSCQQLHRAIQQNFYENQNTLTRYHKENLKRQRSMINTFWAQVLRVIDGDTIQVRIDLRFGASLTQELRLRGINCPELKDPGGQGEKVKKFTEEEFQKLVKNSQTSQTPPNSNALPWILIVTYKTDKFGRYVADVYSSSVYESEEELLEKGDFLNQKLLSAGLAKRVEY